MTIVYLNTTIVPIGENVKWVYKRDNADMRARLSLYLGLARIVSEIIHTSRCSNVLSFAGTHATETSGGGENRTNTWYQNNPRSSRPRRASSILGGSAATGDTPTYRHAICPPGRLQTLIANSYESSSVVTPPRRVVQNFC